MRVCSIILVPTAVVKASKIIFPQYPREPSDEGHDLLVYEKPHLIQVVNGNYADGNAHFACLKVVNVQTITGIARPGKSQRENEPKTQQYWGHIVINSLVNRVQS